MEVVTFIDENVLLVVAGKDRGSVPYKHFASQLIFSIKSGIWKECSLISLRISSWSHVRYFRQDYDESEGNIQAIFHQTRSYSITTTDNQFNAIDGHIKNGKDNCMSTIDKNFDSSIDTSRRMSASTLD